MSTLADELLNDFEDSGSDEEQATNENGIGETATAHQFRNGVDVDMDDDGDDDDDADSGKDGRLAHDMSRKEALSKDEDDEQAAKDRVEKMQLGSVSDVQSVAVLMSKLEPVVEKINHYRNLPPDQQTTFVGSIEDNPEYHLLTQSNTLSTSIDNEIILVHKFIRDHYSARFPELERLVQNPLDYAKTVAIIGNGPLDKDSIKTLAQSSENPIGQALNRILDGPSLMVVTVEASTSRGEQVSSEEMQRIQKACEMTLSLDRAKKTLTDYVQSRMNMFAPNLTALISSLTAAQLLNFAGGITGLAKTPACNIAPLGSKKQNQSYLATNVGVRQQGFLYTSPIIRSIPSHLKRQAMRIVSAKVVLAARVDRVHSSPDGSTGEQLKQECLDRLEKLVEPPPNSGARALPAPDDKPARKRGGRRARKMKEATAMTDLRKEQNRMAFGREEKEVGYADSSKGMGMIGQQNDGRVRALQVDQRTRAKLGKNHKGWGVGTATPLSSSGFGENASVLNGAGLGASGLRTSGVGGASATSGTASTIAFTPVQGLELADPKKRAEMARKAAAETDRWFKGGTFTQINGGTAPAPKAATDKDGFKVPALPPKIPKT